MTMPLRNTRPGKTERSHGRGSFPNPASNFHRPELPFPEGEDKRDVALRRRAELRLDATNSTETVEEMYTALGNPDAYGPDEPLVQESAVRPSGRYAQPIIRTGVQRQQ